MRDCFERDGDLLSHEQRGKAEQIIYALVTFDEDGDIMDINEMYEITLQQEVLNEQAAQLLGEVSRLRAAAREKGDLRFLLRCTRMRSCSWRWPSDALSTKVI